MSFEETRLGRLWQRTEIDGVPVFWGEMQGPFAAELSFRTGIADEGFAQRGWTHAVEHLALAPQRVQPHQYNGQVDLFTTRFGTQGSTDEVVEFLDEVCRALQALPRDRWEAERRILGVEADRREPAGVSRLLLERYGAGPGPGAMQLEEWGLEAATPDLLQQWSSERFTSGNAVLVLSGPPPPELRLALAPGARFGLPSLPRQLVPAGRLVVRERFRHISVGMVVPGDPAATLLGELLREHLTTQLRYDAGLSYDVSTDLLRLSDDRLHLSVFADCSADDRREVARRIADSLNESAGSGFDLGELDGVRRSLLTRMEGAHQAVGRAASAARSELFGSRFTPESYEDAMRAARPEDLQACLAAGWDDAHLGVALAEQDGQPGEHLFPGDSPAWSPWLPTGRELDRFDHATAGERILVTEDGIGLHVGADRFVTAQWENLAGVAAHDDGIRRIVNAEGFVVRLAPWDWNGGDRLSDLIDRLTPSDRLVPSRTIDLSEEESARRDEAARDGRGKRRSSAPPLPSRPPLDETLPTPGPLTAKRIGQAIRRRPWPLLAVLVVAVALASARPLTVVIWAPIAVLPLLRWLIAARPSALVIDPLLGQVEARAAAALASRGRLAEAADALDALQPAQRDIATGELENLVAVAAARDLVADQPERGTAHLLLGAALLGAAWERRGSGDYEEVPPMARLDFTQLTHDAQRSLERAADLAPDDPSPWFLMLRAETARNGVDRRRYLEETLRRRPNHLAAMGLYLQLCGQRWFGSKNEAVQEAFRLMGTTTLPEAQALSAVALLEDWFWLSTFEKNKPESDRLITGPDAATLLSAALSASLGAPGYTAGPWAPLVASWIGCPAYIGKHRDLGRQALTGRPFVSDTPWNQLNGGAQAGLDRARKLLGV